MIKNESIIQGKENQIIIADEGKLLTAKQKKHNTTVRKEMKQKRIGNKHPMELFGINQHRMFNSIIRENEIFAHRVISPVSRVRIDKSIVQSFENKYHLKRHDVLQVLKLFQVTA
jgi:hypothetical protein